MESISNHITDIFFAIAPIYKVAFIFFVALIEGLPVIGSFFPGGTIALFVGILSGEGFIDPVNAIIIISLGSFVGDMTGFLLGRKFKQAKWIKKIIDHEKHQKKWDLFDRHIVLIILFSRVVPLVRSLPSIFAGARNIKTLKYLILSLAGSFIWSIGMVYGGNIIGKLFGRIAIPIALSILLISIVITIVLSLKKKS